MSPSRGLTAFVCAGGLALVLATHVFVKIDRARFKIVVSPVAAEQGRVRVTTGGLDVVRLHLPVAVIARVRHDSPGVAVFAIEIDGVPVCERRARESDPRRLDCSVTAWGPGTEHVVTVTGPPSPWMLDYLELATHHGSASGALELVVLPAGAGGFTHPAPAAIAALSLLGLLLMVLPPPRLLPRWLDLALTAGGCVVIALLALIQCSNWLSAYEVVLSLGTFVRWAGLAFAPRLWLVISWVASAPTTGSPDEREAHQRSGPRRVGYSLLTLAASAGGWERYPRTMVWLILLSLAATVFVLAVEAQSRGSTPVVGALVLAIPGFWASVQTGLPEPVAAAALVGGLLCLWRRHAWLAGALFALSLLVRETGVVAVACAAAAAAIARRRRDACIVITLAGGVALAWRLYVAWMLFPDWGVEGLLFHPHDLGWPLAGISDLWRSIAGGRYYPGVPELSRAGVAHPLLLIAGFCLASALAFRVGIPSRSRR